MNKKNEYTIVVRRERVVVTYDVYKAYHAEREHARYLSNEARKREIPMEWLEDHGVNPKYADTAPLPLDIVIQQDQYAKLRTALRSLPEVDQTLIYALFFERKSERQMAKELGITQKGVNKRKAKILVTLRKMIEM